MARVRVSLTAQDDAGNAAGGDNVEVTAVQAGTTTAKTRYLAATGADTAANPGRAAPAALETTLSAQAAPADTTLTVVSTTGWAVGDIVHILSGSNIVDTRVVKTVTSATVLTLEAAVGGAFTFPVGSTVRSPIGSWQGFFDDTEDTETYIRNVTTGERSERKVHRTNASPAHGPSSHPDRTRRLWIPAEMFTLAAGTPALAAQGANTRYSAWAFDAAADEYIVTEFYLPLDTTGAATLVVKIVWTNLGAGAGNVVWEFFDAAVADTGDLNATAGEGSNTEALAAPAQHILKTSAISAPGLPAQSTNLVRFRFGRRGSSASDTLGNDAGLLGLLIEYTADE